MRSNCELQLNIHIVRYRPFHAYDLVCLHINLYALSSQPITSRPSSCRASAFSVCASTRCRLTPIARARCAMESSNWTRRAIRTRSVLIFESSSVSPRSFLFRAPTLLPTMTTMKKTMTMTLMMSRTIAMTTKTMTMKSLRKSTIQTNTPCRCMLAPLTPVRISRRACTPVDQCMNLCYLETHLKFQVRAIMIHRRYRIISSRSPL